MKRFISSDQSSMKRRRKSRKPRGHATPAGTRGRRFAPRVEQLEDRCVPTTISWIDLGDNDADDTGHYDTLPLIDRQGATINVTPSFQYMVGTSPLALDTTIKGTPLTTTLLTGPTNGVLNPDPVTGLLLGPKGQFSYTPAPGFTGKDEFFFSITDGTDTVTSHCTITVEAAPVLAPAAPPTLDGGSAWPTFHQNSSRDGKMPVAVAPITSPALAWVNKPSGLQVYGSPIIGAVGATGSVYASPVGNAQHMDLLTGAKLWGPTTAAIGYGTSTPALDASGRVYTGSELGKLFAFDAVTGAQLWSFTGGTADEVFSSPALPPPLPAGAGAPPFIIYGSDGPFGRSHPAGRVFALRSNGTEAWETLVNGPVRSAPVFAADPTNPSGFSVYVGCMAGGATLSGFLYKLDAFTGRVLWQHEFPWGIESSPVVNDLALSPTPLVFAVDHLGGNLHAISPSTGALVWSQPLLGITESSPAVDTADFGGSGAIYLATDAGLFKFNATTGALAWSDNVGQYLWASPALVGGTAGVAGIPATAVYFASWGADARLYAASTTTGAVAWNFAIHGVFNWTFFGKSSPAVDGLGSIVIGEEGGQVLKVVPNIAPVLPVPTFFGPLGPGGFFVVVNQPINGLAAANDENPYDTLTYSLDNAPAGATIDPNTGAFSWTPSANQTGMTFTFGIKVADGFDVRSPSSVNLSDEKWVTVTVEPPPQVQIVAVMSAVEGRQPGMFMVYRTNSFEVQVTVTYTVAGTAAPGEDYVPLTGTVTLPPGAMYVPIMVMAPPDPVDPNAPESVIVTLQPGSLYTVGPQNVATVLIFDPPPGGGGGGGGSPGMSPLLGSGSGTQPHMIAWPPSGSSGPDQTQGPTMGPTVYAPGTNPAMLPFASPAKGRRAGAQSFDAEAIWGPDDWLALPWESVATLFDQSQA
jgi:outer membrane protein assembly factor BamB